MEIDINCDLGESYGIYTIGRDEEVMPFISSANIACGFHGGDPVVIQKTIENALKFGIAVGAHPSFPDLHGFGRRNMQLAPEELKSILLYQISALKGMTETLGGKLQHVKPHGALYNMVAKDEVLSKTVVESVLAIDNQLKLFGQPGSVTQKIALEAGITFVAEAFADRAYNMDGSLVSRSIKGSKLSDHQLISDRILGLLQNQKIQTIDGSEIVLQAQTICLHGDNENVLNIAQSLNQKLSEKGIKIRPYAKVG